MPKVEIEELATVIQEAYQSYADDVEKILNDEVNTAINGMVKESKSEANVDTGDFKRNISKKDTSISRWSISRTWYVKDPFFRITHLLVKNHKLRNGKSYTSKDFLTPIVEKWQDSYIRNVLERIKRLSR